jgi:hypothetical protein
MWLSSQISQGSPGQGNGFVILPGDFWCFSADIPTHHHHSSFAWEAWAETDIKPKRTSARVILEPLILVRRVTSLGYKF